MQSKRSRDENSNENSSDSSHEAKPKKKSKKELREDVRQVHTATTGRTGGVYIPPFKMRLIEKTIKDKESKEYQRLTWDALKKSLNGIVNKVSQKNIAKIIPELFSENLMRGKGPLCQSLIKAQAAAVGFSNVYASLVAVINTKLPEIGELLSIRLISAWTKAYQRNQKSTLISTSIFIAHMVNQYVIGSLVPLQILALLLDKPTDDGVEVAVNFIKECGQRLSKMSPKPFNGIFNVFRSILHEGTLDKRVQYMIEHLFIIRKSSFAEHPAMIEELDLVEAGDQVTHDYLSLDDDYDEDLGENFNIFNYDENFEESERRYEAIRKEILGDSDEETSEDEEEQAQDAAGQVVPSNGLVVDKTAFDTVTFKKQVFLTVMSSLDFEECAHKLLKAGVPPNYELDLCRMLVDCCSQERSYRRFYGLLCQRFCVLKQNFRSHFQDTCFAEQYENCHMLETNRLRHVALLYSHLLYSDAIAWSVFSCIHLTVEETNPSKRIFIKTVFKELSEFLGDKLNERLQDPDMQEYYAGIMPKNNPEQTRFSINFFTSIGLGPLTVDMRNHLKALKDKKNISLLPSSSEESSSSLSTSSENSDSSSDSDSDSSSDDQSKRRKISNQIENKKPVETKRDESRGRNEMRVEIKKEDIRDTRKEMPRESQQRDNRDNNINNNGRRDDDRRPARAQDERRDNPRERVGGRDEERRGDDRRREPARDERRENPREERRENPREERRDERRDNYRDNRDDRGRRENERREGARDNITIKREPEY
jgi:pre-mRNA-splicing factor CWC22